MSEDLIVWQTGIVKGFKLTFFNEPLYGNILGYYNNKQVEVCIREKRKKVSPETHGFYRGVILPICLQSEMFGGWKINEIHDYFASKYLADIKEKILNGNTIIIKTTLSTGGISQALMNQFIENVRQELEENQISTPDPIKNGNQKNLADNKS